MKIPRRPARVQPSLRGRAAAVPPFGQTPYIRPIIRQRPASSRKWMAQIPQQPGQEAIDPGLPALYQQWPALFKVLNRPWKGVVALVAVVLIAIAIGSLL
jgi:hypothetical protein